MISLDFDGVLIKHPCNLSFKEILEHDPMPDVVRIINYLASVGVEFFVLTARTDEQLPLVKEWLKDHGFPDMLVTNKKIPATMYIDDRAVRFTNWEDISKLIR